MKKYLSECEVLAGLSIITRTITTSEAHPQVGYISLDGERTPVYIGFYGDAPMWKVAMDGKDDPEYKYCAVRTTPIERDPDYIGDGAGITVDVIAS